MKVVPNDIFKFGGERAKANVLVDKTITCAKTDTIVRVRWVRQYPIILLSMTSKITY